MAALVTTKGFLASLEFYCEGDALEVYHMCRVKSMQGRADLICILETLRPTVAWWYCGQEVAVTCFGLVLAQYG